MTKTEEFTALVEGEHRRLVGWLYKQVDDRELAQDLAQKTYLHLWKSLERYETIGRALLYCSARQRIIDHYRRAKKTVSLDALSDVAEADAELERVDNHIALEQSLAQMTDKERQLVLLKAAGRTIGEIAQTLGIPEGTVKSRTNYIRHRKPHEVRAAADESKRAVWDEWKQTIYQTATRLVTEAGRITGVDLGEALNIHRSLAQHHLEQMEKAGMLISRGIEIVSRPGQRGATRRMVWVAAQTTKTA